MLKRSWFAVAVTLVAAAAGVGGCSDGGNAPHLLEPSRVEASRVSEGDLHKIRRGKGKAAAVVVARIGAEGGTLESAGHRLTVPAGAVGEPVLFRMRVSEHTVEVDLTATGPQAREENDVGAAGFRVPLQLTLSYADAEPVAEARRLVVAWVRDDGVLVALPSTVDLHAQTVAAELDHFSGYTLAMP